MMTSARLSARRNVELPLIYAGVRPKERRERAEAMLEREDSTVYVVPDRYVFLQDDIYTQEESHSLDIYDDIRERMSRGPKSIGADDLGAELKNSNSSVTVVRATMN